MRAHGLDGATPALIVANASLPDERIVATDLARLGAMTALMADDSPSILLVGEAIGRSMPSRTAISRASRQRARASPGPKTVW